MFLYTILNMQSFNTFPHVVIGNIQKSEPQPLTTIQPANYSSSKIVNGIEMIKNSDALPSESLIKLRELAISEEIPLEAKAAFVKFPELENAFSWYITNRETLTKSTLLNYFSNLDQSEETIQNLYEILTLNTLVKSDPVLVEKLYHALKIVLFIKVVKSSQEELDNNQLIDLFDTLKIIIPRIRISSLNRSKQNVSDSVITEENNSKGKVAPLQSKIALKRSLLKSIQRAEHQYLRKDLKSLKKEIQFEGPEFEKPVDVKATLKTSKEIGDKTSQSDESTKTTGKSISIGDLLNESQKSELDKLEIDYRYTESKLLYQEIEESIQQDIANLLTLSNESAAKSVLVVIDNLVVEVAVYDNYNCTEKPKQSHCDMLSELIEKHRNESYFHLLGMGWYNVIKQEFVRYEKSEIVHNETISSGEIKIREHRNLQTREEYFESETERITENETDMKTTDRFELSKEMTKTASNSSENSFGVGLTAGWGPVSITANASFASQNASQQVTSTSVKNAKEVVQRAIQKIQERVSERQSVKIINEVEVTNRHELNNKSNAPINNFYLAIDKVYKNQVFNLGKKMQIQFTISEPAANHIYSNARKPNKATSLLKPIPPHKYTSELLPSSLSNYGQITQDNYALWGSVYNTADLPHPPASYQTVSKSFGLDWQPGNKGWQDKFINEIEIPKGYKASIAHYNTIFSGGSGRYLAGYVGRAYFSANGHNTFTSILNGETDRVPIIFRGRTNEYAFSIEVECVPTEAAVNQWKIEAYNAIKGAYNNQLQEYEDQIAAAGVAASIKAQNPLLNKQTIKEELIKQCIGMFTGQYFTGFNAMKRSQDGQPELDYQESFNEGAWWQFFLQLFEFDNMMYRFYPYIAGADRRYWSILKHLDDPDHNFMEFIRAGHAKVVVPVRSEMIPHFFHYLESGGEIWNGTGNMPQINDPEYISIVDEIRIADNALNGTPVGNSWETKVPTNLIYVTDQPPSNL